MEIVTAEKFVPEMTLYSCGIDGPVFLDKNEYENFPEDGIVGRVGYQYHYHYEDVVPVEYMRNFDGWSDVFRITNNGEVTFYTLHMIDDIPHVLEGEVCDGKVSWNFSIIDDLSSTYKGFRERGIVFENDYYQREEAEYRAREQRAILQMQLLKEYEEKLATLNKEYKDSLKKGNEQDEVDHSPNSNGVIDFFKRLIKKD